MHCVSSFSTPLLATKKLLEYLSLPSSLLLRSAVPKNLRSLESSLQLKQFYWFILEVWVRHLTIYENWSSGFCLQWTIRLGSLKEFKLWLKWAEDLDWWALVGSVLTIDPTSMGRTCRSSYSEAHAMRLLKFYAHWEWLSPLLIVGIVYRSYRIKWKAAHLLCLGFLFSYFSRQEF